MEKKNEYIDRLLQNLQSLEAKVSAIKQDESVSFSFFRDAFQQGQEMMRLLHELEMFQIEDMKQQMEKLVLFLSESKSWKPEEEIRPVENEEKKNIVPPAAAEGRAPDTLKNTYAEGIVLPAYTNPGNTEPKKEDASGEFSGVIRSVNDVIQAPPPKLDVKRGLSLNDRFYFQRELFDNDRQAMNAMMIRLNAFDNYGDAERHLRENTPWDFKDERVKSFLELLKKGFE